MKYDKCTHCGRILHKDLRENDVEFYRINYEPYCSLNCFNDESEKRKKKPRKKNGRNKSKTL